MSLEVIFNQIARQLNPLSHLEEQKKLVRSDRDICESEMREIQVQFENLCREKLGDGQEDVNNLGVIIYNSINEKLRARETDYLNFQSIQEIVGEILQRMKIDRFGNYGIDTGQISTAVYQAADLFNSEHIGRIVIRNIKNEVVLNQVDSCEIIFDSLYILSNIKYFELKSSYLSKVQAIKDIEERKVQQIKRETLIDSLSTFILASAIIVALNYDYISALAKQKLGPENPVSIELINNTVEKENIMGLNAAIKSIKNPQSYNFVMQSIERSENIHDETEKKENLASFKAIVIRILTDEANEGDSRENGLLKIQEINDWMTDQTLAENNIKKLDIKYVEARILTLLVSDTFVFMDAADTIFQYIGSNYLTSEQIQELFKQNSFAILEKNPAITLPDGIILKVKQPAIDEAIEKYKIKRLHKGKSGKILLAIPSSPDK